MRSILLSTTALTWLVLATPVVAQDRSAATGKAENPAADTAGQAQNLAAGDRQFADKVAMIGMFEIESGKLAQQKGGDAELAKFAQTLIDDHTKAGEQLKSIVTPLGFQPPAQLDADHQAKLDQLKGANGGQFRSQFLTMQAEGHQEAIKLFTQEASQAQNAQLKQFANQTLPTLQNHLQMAQNLRGAGNQANAQTDNATTGMTQPVSPPDDKVVRSPSAGNGASTSAGAMEAQSPRPVAGSTGQSMGQTAAGNAPSTSSAAAGSTAATDTTPNDATVVAARRSESGTDAATAMANRDAGAAATTSTTHGGMGGEEARKLLGADVITADGKKMGEIENLLISPDGQVRAVVIAWGGFLGLGERRTALAWSDVNMGVGQDRDKVVVSMTQDEIRSAPRFTADQQAMQTFGTDTRSMR